MAGFTEAPVAPASRAFLASVQTGVELWPLEKSRLQLYADWRNLPEVRSRTRCAWPLTITDQESWFERVRGNSAERMFEVRVPLTAAGRLAKEPVGVVGLCDWSPRDRTAEISFYIGDPAARGKGYCRAALGLLIDYGFDEMGLDRIWAEVYDFNEPGLKVLGKLGFEVEGRLRQHVWRQGRRCDSILLGLLRSER